MHAVAAEHVPQMLEFGFDELVLTADIGLVRAAFAREIACARSAVREPAQV